MATAAHGLRGENVASSTRALGFKTQVDSPKKPHTNPLLEISADSGPDVTGKKPVPTPTEEKRFFTKTPEETSK